MHVRDRRANDSIPSATFQGGNGLSHICGGSSRHAVESAFRTLPDCAASRPQPSSFVADADETMHVLRQLDVHPKVREEADILVRTFSGAIGKYDRRIVAASECVSVGSVDARG